MRFTREKIEETDCYMEIVQKILYEYLQSEENPFCMCIFGGDFYPNPSSYFEYELSSNKHIKQCEQVFKQLEPSIIWTKKQSKGVLNSLKIEYELTVNNSFIIPLRQKALTNGYLFFHRYSNIWETHDFMNKIITKHMEILDKIGKREYILITKSDIRIKENHEERIGYPEILKFCDEGLVDFTEDWQILGFIFAYCNYMLSACDKDITDNLEEECETYIVSPHKGEFYGYEADLNKLIYKKKDAKKDTKKLAEW